MQVDCDASRQKSLSAEMLADHVLIARTLIPTFVHMLAPIAYLQVPSLIQQHEFYQVIAAHHIFIQLTRVPVGYPARAQARQAVPP